MVRELEVFSPDTAGGDEQQQDELAALIWEFLDIFDDDVTTALGHTGLSFSIDTGTSLPVRAPQYRRPRHQAAIIEQHVRKISSRG